MEKIRSLYVKVNNVSGTTAFMDVIAARRIDSTFVSDSVSIAEIFFGGTKICSRVQNTDVTEKKEQVYELLVQEIVKEDDEEKYPFVKSKSIHPLAQILEISHYNFATDYINIDDPNLKEVISKNDILNANEIFIAQSEDLFGPFKIVNGIFKPKVGKEVNKFKLDKTNQITDPSSNNIFHIDSSSEPVSKIDCMTNGQLIDFFKGIAATTKVDKELFNKVKRIVTSQHIGEDVLKNTRLKRAEQLLDLIVFEESEIERVLSESSRWREVFNSQIVKYEDELKKVISLDFDKETKALDKKKKKILNELDDLQEEYSTFAEKILESTGELKSLEKNKDSLIELIRIQSRIVGNGESDSPKNKTFYEEVTHKSPKALESISFNEKIERICDDELEETKLNEFLERLASRSMFYEDNTSRIALYLQIFDCYTLIIQNVEVDWIKFKNLFKNGLERIVKSASENPKRLHVLVLNDYNVAAFELYGKPIADIILGRRSFIPGTKIPFPDNLKIILGIANLSSKDDCFPETSALLEGFVDRLGLQEIKFIKSPVRDKDFNPLLWENVQ